MNIELNNQQEVRFRCPHCQKLYRTSYDVFEGSAPEFDCSGCTKTFFLEKEQDSFGLYKASAKARPVFSSCPKCSSLKPGLSDECPTCGVFASKYLEVQKAESPVLFELNQQWQKVITNFDNDQYHQDFLNKCHLKMALNFAFQKYSELQKTVGFDALCEKYLQQIELRLEQQFKTVADTTPSAEVVRSLTPSSTQWIFMVIGTIGMLALIYNRFVPTFPNFNGLVMMLTVLAFGAGLFYTDKTRSRL